jgi:hypothetical protein
MQIPADRIAKRADDAQARTRSVAKASARDVYTPHTPPPPADRLAVRA